MNTIIRPFRFCLFVLLGAAGLTAGLALFAACAQGAVVVSDGPVPYVAVAPGELASQVVPWLLGALVALKVLEMALARISPLTKTTWDDEAYQKLHAVNEIATEILTRVQSPTTVITNVNPPPAPAATTAHTAETSPGTIDTIDTKDGAS